MKSQTSVLIGPIQTGSLMRSMFYEVVRSELSPRNPMVDEGYRAAMYRACLEMHVTGEFNRFDRRPPTIDMSSPRAFASYFSKKIQEFVAETRDSWACCFLGMDSHYANTKPEAPGEIPFASTGEYGL